MTMVPQAQQEIRRRWRTVRPSFSSEGVPTSARQPHPDPARDEGGGRRRACLGGRAVGRSAQSAVLRAAGGDPDCATDHLRLTLTGVPAGRRSGLGRVRSPGCEPLPHAERLEHRHHHLRGAPHRLERPSWPPGRRAGPHQRLARLRGGQRHSGLRGEAGRGHVDRLRHRRPGGAREPFGADGGASGLRCRGTAASLSRPPRGHRVGHQRGVDTRTGRGVAKRGGRVGRGHRQGEAGPRGTSAHCALERTGPSRSPCPCAGGRRTGRRRTDGRPDAVDRAGPG